MIKRGRLTAVAGLLSFLSVAMAEPPARDLVFSSNRYGDTDIFLLEAGAREWRNLTRHPAGDNWPVWSPDGSRIAFQSSRNGKLDIFVMNADGSGLQQLTDHPEHDYLPSWTPDGRQITFVSWRLEPGEEEPLNHFYIMNGDGSGQRRFLPESPLTSASLEWSPDGRHLLTTRKLEQQGDLFLVAVAGGEAFRLTDEADYNGSAVFSPDGARISFYSDTDDTSRIETMRMDGTDRQVIAPSGKNYYPHWSPDGCWLAWMSRAEDGPENDFDIVAAPSDGTGEPLVLVSGPGREGEASWRPGGGPSPRCAGG